MKHARIELARSADLLPDLSGVIAVFGPLEVDRLQGLDPKKLVCVNHSYVMSELARARGLDVQRNLVEQAEHAVVFVPRSKDEFWHLLAQALKCVRDGWIVVDGQKTDGIDSIAKQISRAVPAVSSYSKGHGKTVWFKAAEASVLLEKEPQHPENKGGFQTAPGVFSADSVDPASEMLVQNLPNDLSGQYGDLGAGWGYLSSQLLQASPSISQLHLVEDNGVALDCARQNVQDPRAEFHWADALKWKSEKLLDGIVMNPPFHSGRTANPELGKDFIKAAARTLRPGGKLFMVANAHLPYEPVLEQSFAKYELLARSTKFKVFCATRGRDKVS